MGPGVQPANLSSHSSLLSPNPQFLGPLSTLTSCNPDPNSWWGRGGASGNRYLQKKVIKVEALPLHSGFPILFSSYLPTSRARSGRPAPLGTGCCRRPAGSLGASACSEAAGGTLALQGREVPVYDYFLHMKKKMELFFVWIYSSKCRLNVGGW